MHWGDFLDMSAQFETDKEGNDAKAEATGPF
jgi:hypothetical protein